MEAGKDGRVSGAEFRAEEGDGRLEGRELLGEGGHTRHQVSPEREWGVLITLEPSFKAFQKQ